MADCYSNQAVDLGGMGGAVRANPISGENMTMDRYKELCDLAYQTVKELRAKGVKPEEACMLGDMCTKYFYKSN